MSISAVKAGLCLVLPLVSGLSFTAPEPTLSAVVSSNPPPPGPQTTPPPVPKRRRDEATTDTYRVTDEPNMCGWEDAVYDNGITCGVGQTCGFQRPNEKYPGMLACCDEGMKNCDFYSTCINFSEVSATPSLTDTRQPFALYCTESASPACMTWYYDAISVTDFGCSEDAGGVDMYTWATDPTTTSGTVDEYSLYLTPIGTEAVDSYKATFSSMYDHKKATNGPSATPTPSSDANADSGSESSNTGAIAGGVVGGVAGIALIGAAGFFIGKKMSKKKAAGAGGTAGDDSKGSYSTVPDAHSPNPGTEPSSGTETHFPSEMGTGEPSQELAEIPGSTPADRVYEMQGTAVKDTTVNDTAGKNFVSELPADSEFPAKK